MFVVDDADCDRFGYAGRGALVLNVNVGCRKTRQYWIASAAHVSVNDHVFCVCFPVCGGARDRLRRHIAGAHARALRDCRVLVEVTTKLSDRAEQQAENRYHDRQLDSLHTPFVAAKTTQPMHSTRSPHVANFFYAMVHHCLPPYLYKTGTAMNGFTGPPPGLKPPWPTTMSSMYSATRSPPLPLPTLVCKKKIPKRSKVTSS